MRWLVKHEDPPAAQQFNDLLNEVIEDFEHAVERHRQKLAELREAISDQR